MSSRMRHYILTAAGDLFSRQGFNSTSVDNIAAQAQVAKVTLYKYFQSKELLIIEYLREQNAKLWQTLAESPQQDNARAELEAMALGLLAVIAEKEFKGFASLSAGVEFPQLDNPINQVSQDFSRQLREQMAALANKAGIKQAEALALQLALVIEGASMTVRNQQGSESLAHAQALVQTLIKSAT